MNDRHHQIDRHAERAQAEIRKHSMRAMEWIDEMLERYRIEDAFRNRSLAQKRRWANFRKFTGGGK